MTILARDPVREEFAGCSTSNNYFNTKGSAVLAFDTVLLDYGYRLDDANIVDMYGNEGRASWPVCTNGIDGGEVVGNAIFTWYRVPSGRWEVIGYLA